MPPAQLRGPLPRRTRTWNRSGVPTASPSRDGFATCQPRTSASATSSTKRPAPASARPLPSPRASPNRSPASPAVSLARTLLQPLEFFPLTARGASLCHSSCVCRTSPSEQTDARPQQGPSRQGWPRRLCPRLGGAPALPPSSPSKATGTRAFVACPCVGMPQRERAYASSTQTLSS